MKINKKELLLTSLVCLLPLLAWCYILVVAEDNAAKAAE